MGEKIEDIIILCSFLGCIGATVEALAGWGLSFIALPSLVRGGMIGSVFPVLFVVWHIGKLLYNLYNGKGIEEEDKNKLIHSSKVALAFAAIGVGLAAVGVTSGADIGAFTIFTYLIIVESIAKAIKLCSSKEQGDNDLSQNPSETPKKENNTSPSQLLEHANPQEISGGRQSLDPAR
ncbi:MAG: hypothetical protein PG981_000005 [Wolbachia endosymbiont of Ctenocephalides orientis wCori]|nr:MAG: hypothetical protein PG981_000005 [Wolbachia endosymbiont of Ctenocephalides orientis wCori]